MFNIGSKRIGNNGRVAQGEPETSSVNKISEIFNDLTKLTHNQLRTLINAVLVNDVNRFSQQSIEHRLYNSLITLLYGATRNNHKSSKFVVQFMAIAYICLNGVEQSFNTQSTNFKYDNFVNWLYTSVDTKNYLRRINFTIIKLDSIEAIKRNLAYQSVEFKIDRQTFSLPVNLFINVQNNAQVCQKVFHQLSQLSHYQLGSLLKAVSAGDIQLVQGQEICQNIYPDFMLLINYNIANNGYYTEDFLQFMMLTFIYFNGIEKSFYPYNHTFQYNAFIKWLGTNDNYKKLNINMELINLQNTNLISHNVTTRNIDFKIKEQTISLPYRLFAHSPTIPGNRTNQQLGGATQALNKRRSIKYTYIDNRGYEDGIVITSGSDNKKFSSLAIPTVIEYSANARNTERFEGAFNSESETYNGILTYKNGNLFKGQLKHDLRHGLGIYTNQATKVSITGEWSENKLLLNETFTINYPNNDSITVEEFEGELDSNNRFCGIVKLFFSNGTSYRGKLKNGLATEGTFTNLLSHEICGTWENNQLDISKPFTLTYPNKGSLKVEEFNGDITPTGRINGEGKFVFADGASYHGKIEYNVMCGRGIYTNSNGMKFEGGWEGNKLIKDQPFKIVFPNGKTLEVISCEGDIDYDLGIVSGRVTMLYFEGEYSGYIKQNSKHGEGIYTDNKGVKFKGKWSDDKAVDKFEVSYPAEHKFQLKLTKDTVLQFDKFTGEITNECEPKKGTFTAIDKPNDKFEVEFYPHAKIGTYITPEKSIKGKWRKECRALNSQFTIIYHTDPGLRRKKFVGSVTEDLEPLCGIMEYQDNSLYEGRFKNNFRDGISSVTTPSFKAVISYTDGQITSGTSIKYTNYIIGSSIAAELSIENNPNQMKYTGSVNAELEPHGFGIAEYVNGDRFEGEFNHGFRDSGVLIRINRDKLEWKDGKLSSITYPDGDSIRRVINEHDNSTSWIYKYIKTGEEFELNVIIKDDITTREYQSDNKTIIVAQDGTRKYRRIRMAPKVYNVPLVEYTFANGEVYRGNMDENGKKHGFGKLQYPNGDVYEGNFSQDKFEGHGTYISAATNEIYKGLFKNGERHGRGIISYPNGDTYKGEFCNGKKEKEWIYTSHDDKYTFIETYVSGSIPEPVRLYLYEGVSPFSYSGQLEDNQPNGLGESFSSFLNIEVRYTGIFKNGQQEGYGSLKDSEGIEYTGYFKNNLFNGMGILKKTVLEFNGYFENGEFIRGFLNHRIDNAIYSGGFYKLSPHGENIIWYRENFNEISIGKMNHGQKVGVWITVNVEEQIAAKYNYNKGSFSQKQQFDFIRAKQDIKRSEAQNDQALHKLLVDTNSMFILAGGTIEYADKSTLTVAKDTATNWLYCDEYGTQFKLVEPIALQGITITPNVIGCYRPEHATNDNKNVVILLDENYSDTNPLPINSRCRIYTMVSIVSGTYNEETGELSNTSIKFSNHNIYKGAINNLCKPHATRGELIYKNGDNYTGEFENGQNSRGLFKFWQGQYTYVGKFTNGLFEGNSILTCAVEVKSEEVRIDYAYLRPGDKLKGYFEKGKFIIGECIVSFPEKIKDFIHPQKVPTITICGRFKDFQPDGDEIIVYSPDKFNPTQILIGPMNKGQWSGRVTVININQNNKEAWEIPYAQGKINQHREKRKVQVIDAEQKINTAQKKLDEELALRIRNKS